MNIVRSALLTLALTLSASAQIKYNYIASTGQVVLAGAATAATLQQPATNSLPVSFPQATNGGAPPAGASVYCSAACVYLVPSGGTAGASNLVASATLAVGAVPGGVSLPFYLSPGMSLQVAWSLPSSTTEWVQLAVFEP